MSNRKVVPNKFIARKTTIPTHVPARAKDENVINRNIKMITEKKTDKVVSKTEEKSVNKMDEVTSKTTEVLNKAISKVESDKDDKENEVNKTSDESVLLLLSGGFDSTATLIYLLSETKYTVHALHLNFASKLGKIEYNGCKNIAKYCRENIRPFKYFERGMDQFTTNVGMNITREESAKWCNDQAKKGNVYKYLVFGRCKVDLRGNFKQRAESAEKIFTRHLNNHLKRKIKFYYPILSWDKYKIVTYIPPCIIGHVWTCQRPSLTNKRIPQNSLRIIQNADQRNGNTNKATTRAEHANQTVMVPDATGGFKIIRTSTKRKTAPVKVVRPESVVSRKASIRKQREQVSAHRNAVYKTNNFKPCQQCSSCKDIITLIRKHPDIRSIHPNFERYHV